MTPEAEKLESFQQRLQERLIAANRQPEWLPVAEQATDQLAASCQVWEAATDQLRIATIRMLRLLLFSRVT